MDSNTDTKDALSLRLSQVAALAAEQERPASDVALELLTGGVAPADEAFTPTTDQVRDGYAIDPESEYHDPIGYPATERWAKAAFDRWLAALIRETRAPLEQEIASLAARLASPPKKNVRVSRDGHVIVGSLRIGYVDRYDTTVISRIGKTWRGVKEGGRSRSGFATREAAIEWVVTP